MVMRLLREELAPIPEKMVARQGRGHPPSPTDRLNDSLWRALSTSGEIRWITDLDLLRKVAAAYELVGVEASLEERWRRARGDWGMAGKETMAAQLSNDLISLDTDAWRLVCEACKALDIALVRDGAPAGSNADALRCPS
jgi:hypothetical protein